MAASDPKFIGIANPTLILQEGAGFEENEPGQFDTGTKVYLTHFSTPRSKWPQRGEKDSVYSGMRVSKVVDRLLECRLIELTIGYKGALKGDLKPALVRSGADAQMLSLPARSGSSSGAAATVIAPVPVPTCSREFVTSIKPSAEGVGLPFAGDFLPLVPSFSLTFYPDPSQPFPLNYFSNQWILQSRTWDDSTPGTWLVCERFAYYYSIAI